MSTRREAFGLSYELLGTPLHRVPAFVSENGPKAGLVVIQEWWGVNDQVKKTASDIAVATGCQIVVPDLYRSKVCYEAAEAEHELSSLDWPGALRDVGESALWLKAQGCENVGVLGFCMGGALALGSGVSLPQVDACVSFYGWNAGLGDVSEMCTPTQCHFGGKDTHVGFSDPATADKLDALLESSGCIYEFFRYPDQGHGFMNGTEWGKEMNLKLVSAPFLASCSRESAALDRAQKIEALARPRRPARRSTKPPSQQRCSASPPSSKSTSSRRLLAPRASEPLHP